MNFQLFKLVLKKAEEPDIKLPTSIGSWKKQESSRNDLFLFYCLCQNFDCLDHHKLWKFLKEMGIPEHLSCLLRNLYTDQEATLRTGHEITDWFQIGKGVHQGCILSPCLYNLMESTSQKMLGWMKHKLESRLLGEIAITSDMQMASPLLQRVKKN